MRRLLSVWAVAMAVLLVQPAAAEQRKERTTALPSKSAMAWASLTISSRGPLRRKKTNRSAVLEPMPGSLVRPAMAFSTAGG